MLHNCRRCDKIFASKWHLSRHEETHKGDKSYRCKTCGALFGELAILTWHVHLHGGKSHWCLVCGVKFPNLSLLNMHSKSHR